MSRRKQSLLSISTPFDATIVWPTSQMTRAMLIGQPFCPTKSSQSTSCRKRMPGPSRRAIGTGPFQNIFASSW